MNTAAMSEKELREIKERRDYLVVKSNDIIRKARYSLTLQELKILSFCLSMIKPNDSIDTVYTFSINEYCKAAGIDYESGRNYNSVKDSLLAMVKKAFWIPEADGSEVTIHWIEKARLSRGKGKILIRFDDDLKRYVFNLFRNFTQYELLCVLPMKSKYSFRLYELLKSYAFAHVHTFKLDELKNVLMAEGYDSFRDFRRKVIEPAVIEINTYTDIRIEWQKEQKGRNVEAITFVIVKLNVCDYGKNRQKANAELGRQMTIFDFIPEDRGKGE